MPSDATISIEPGGAGTRRGAPTFSIFTVGAAAIAVALLSVAVVRQPWKLSAGAHDHAASGAAMQANASLRPTAQILSSDALTHVRGKRVTTVVVEFPPSGFSPPHHHGGSVTVYVLSGAIRSQLQGTPPHVYRPGETFFEPLGITHLLAENISATESARILAVFVADDGAPLTTYHE